MKSSKYIYLSLFFFILAILSVYSIRVIKGSSVQGRKVQNVFEKKIKDTKNYIQEVRSCDFIEAAKKTDKAVVDGLAVLVFSSDTLVFWSDNDVPYSQLNLKADIDGQVIKLSNTEYYSIVEVDNNTKYVGLIRLANDYPYENKFLINGIHSDFTRYAGKISLQEKLEDAYSIYDDENNFAFSVQFDESVYSSTHLFVVLSTVFLLLGVFYLFVFLRFMLVGRFRENIAVALPVVMISLLLVRCLLVFSGVLNDTFYLFEPYIYAHVLAPTLGDLILNTVLFLFFSYLVFHFVKIPKKFIDNKYNQTVWITILNVFLLFCLWYVQKISVSLITDSSLFIVVHNISQISVATILAYLIFAFHYFGFFLIAFWVNRNLEGISTYKPILNFSTLLIVFYLLSFSLKLTIDIYTAVFALVIYVLITLLKNKLLGRAIFSSLVLLLLVFSVYILFFTVHFSNPKENIINRSFAEGLANEHDQVAEYLFEDIAEKITQDQEMAAYIDSDDFDIYNLYSSLSSKYFKGYLKKYNLRVTLCGLYDSVPFEIPEGETRICHDYFKNLINEFGVKVPGAPFYYMENLSGLISYFGWIKFEQARYGEVSIFLELDSKLSLATQPLGYPELLIDKRVKKRSYFDRFSYAKYNEGKLISHHGDYGYSLISDIFKKPTSNFFYEIKHDGYKHLVYHPNTDNLVVVSEEDEGFLDWLVVFSYLFVFYYVIALGVMFIMVSRYRYLSFRDSLRNKIQFSVILILMASLILIAGSTILFNIRKYNQAQFNIISEKIQSVYTELEHKLSFEDRLTKSWKTDKYESLDQLLIKFSDVFYSDINLYSPEGNLLATSRPEVYQLGLQNLKMEPMAYYKMHSERLAKYVQSEHINQLSYLSAYVPFVNSKGELLAYLNLPYFTKQQELQEDITTLTVAIVNIYVLLILLTIIIAVVISNQITKPLEMLQARFRDLTLGGGYEQIDYHRHDEIGRLVNEYNQMVKELQRNIDLLAKSERESAWREMAKQVAHEIKNPLTPMRLSVQQLQRAWGDKKDNFDMYLNRVSETLIEQIDNLSKIASEFSNFAKMPVAQIEEVNLVSILSKVGLLFKGNEKVKIELDLSEQKLVVKADSEQLNRVFINIVKNGIQSIPDQNDGHIQIKLFKDGGFAVVNIIDNGKGIPKEIRNKLFMPNFTTKTSGMGLGLAIVKNTLEQIGGEIDFKTEIGVGTSFRIKLPLMANENKNDSIMN